MKSINAAWLLAGLLLTGCCEPKQTVGPPAFPAEPPEPPQKFQMQFDPGSELWIAVPVKD